MDVCTLPETGSLSPGVSACILFVLIAALPPKAARPQGLMVYLVALDGQEIQGLKCSIDRSNCNDNYYYIFGISYRSASAICHLHRASCILHPAFPLSSRHPLPYHSSPYIHQVCIKSSNVGIHVQQHMQHMLHHLDLVDALCKGQAPESPSTSLYRRSGDRSLYSRMLPRHIEG